MGETTGTEKAPKKSFFKGLKAEFNKIVWPDQETVGKHIAREHFFVRKLLHAVLEFCDFEHRNGNFEDLILKVTVLNGFLNVNFNFVLVA